MEDKTEKPIQRSNKSQKRKSVYEKVMESDVGQCQRIFKEYDIHKQGFINYYDLKAALEKCGIKFYYSQCFHKMLSELKHQDGKINFFDFTKMVVNHRKNEEGKEDMLDAFVAMGGEENGDGNIDADKLISIIKHDFGMSIDIETLIKEIDADESGEIEFDEFQSLLACDGENPEIEQFKSWFSF